MEDNKELIVMIIATLAGTFAIVASIYNWNFFFESRKAKFMTSFLGRDGARLFYGCVGLLLYYLCYKIYQEQNGYKPQFMQ